MLEGLEISEVLLSRLERTSRLDSEFYSKENIVIDKLLQSKDTKSIGQITKVSDGNHMSISNKFIDSGIPYYRGQNIHDYFIEESNPICIDEQTYNIGYLKRSHLKKGDVLLSIVGTIGGVALVSTNNKATCNCKLAILRPESINGFYLSMFLKTKFGQNQIQKFKRGAVQMGLILEDMNQIYVPVLSNNFQSQIETLINLSKSKSDNSKQTYKQAENILLQEIGLQDFKPSKEPVNVKSFKDSFAKSGRLDAEYYQNKYDDYLKLIDSYSNGSKTIATICNLNGKNFKPEDKKIYNYIELSNVGKTGDINGCTVDFGKELPSRARRKVNTGDVIISSIEGSLESCALVTEEYNNALCSTGFYVINSDIINSESLLVLFKSELMQNVLKQNCSGTILTGLNKDDFLNIRLPKIIENKQQLIAGYIEQSFTLKKQSEHLLEVAKKAVEMAIEENEENALEFIKNETNE